jgi:hypothetical protein
MRGITTAKAQRIARLAVTLRIEQRLLDEYVQNGNLAAIHQRRVVKRALLALNRAVDAADQ